VDEVNIAVFVSGNGTNLQALMDADLAGGKIMLVVSDKKDAFALERAKKKGVKTFVLTKEGFDTREAYDQELVKQLKEEQIELVILAGFMKILSPYFVNEYKNKILNIHPSLLPSFKGLDGVKEAYGYGVKVTGVTIHFVTDKLDEGKIMMQEPVAISKEDTIDSLREKIHKVEHRLYPEAVRHFVRGELI